MGPRVTVRDVVRSRVPVHELSKAVSPATDADLERARRDVEFRQKLLTESLDILLDELQRRRRLHATPATSAKVQSSPSAWPK
jgi:hypothetical protein